MINDTGTTKGDKGEGGGGVLSDPSVYGKIGLAVAGLLLLGALFYALR